MRTQLKDQNSCPPSHFPKPSSASDWSLSLAEEGVQTKKSMRDIQGSMMLFGDWLLGGDFIPFNLLSHIQPSPDHNKSIAHISMQMNPEVNWKYPNPAF